MPQKPAPFNGGPAGPADAQDFNQGVYDNPKHGVSRTAPSKQAAPKHLSGSGPSGNASDMTAKPPVIYRHDGEFKKVDSSEKGRLDLTDRKQDDE